MILIVDDNSEMRQMIRSVIEDLDSEFCEGADGSEALALYQKYRPDWVLIDLAMHEMDGLTATRQIIAAFPEAKIAIVSSFDDVGLRNAAKTAGANKYFIKEKLFELRGLFTKTS